MQQRPAVGIPTQNLKSIDRIPEDLPDSWLMNQRDFHACTSVDRRQRLKVNEAPYLRFTAPVDSFERLVRSNSLC